MSTRACWIPGTVIAALLAGGVICCLVTHVSTNATMMLFEKTNVLPQESSIFWFDPYVINQGSSNYWLYARDRQYYYHFIYQDQARYVYLPVDNTCPGFDRADILTWCNVRTGGQR